MPTDQLIDAVWGEQPPPSASAALHNHLARLRRWLGGEGSRIRAVAPGYLIQVEPGELDLHTFVDLCASGLEAVRGGRWATASTDLSAALELWRGLPVADVPRLHGQDARIQQLLESRLHALEGRIEAHIHLGRQNEVIGELRALTTEHPLREVFHGQLMLALYRADRQAESLDVFQGLRRVLIDELAVEPSAAVQDLFSRILRGDPELALGAPDPTDDMPPPGLAPGDPGVQQPVPHRPAQLPADIAAFTGRVDQVRQALSALTAKPGAMPETGEPGTGVPGAGHETVEPGPPVPVVSVISGTAGPGRPPSPSTSATACGRTTPTASSTPAWVAAVRRRVTPAT
ncbi:AfsR/SARP family transcriptional regulator [Streptacidiphilus sp. 4-A2]|nr:AfsR/SARP family transcriptional regulator [Streptacidiphilus sp. 4-A2]